MKKIGKFLAAWFLVCLVFGVLDASAIAPFRIRDRFFATTNGQPFFWLGDTAWLMFVRCRREEILKYLDTRKAQGFNVVQVMVLHDIKSTENAYGMPAIEGQDISKPRVTSGKRVGVKDEYDYWDHVEWTIDEAARRGMYVGLVAVWGSNVKSGAISPAQARLYAEFLAKRFRQKPNIVWLNGGDLRGDVGGEVWQTIGRTLRANDPNHLITFHPRGRHSSSEWFHQEKWLDFNMFQSGHRNYAQDNLPDEQFHYGEDSWRYAVTDYALKPVKPFLDGEPSYENIPQGLHDPKMPRWNADDIRRYVYWSVFAGGAGVTYGENSVMQFYTKGRPNPSYGAEIDWRESINATGAGQMQFLKKLMLSRDYFSRVPAPELVEEQGTRYDYVAATSGRGYAFFYTYNGRQFSVRTPLLSFTPKKAAWFNPRSGEEKAAAFPTIAGVTSFDPPGEKKDGQDWVLILE